MSVCMDLKNKLKISPFSFEKLQQSLEAYLVSLFCLLTCASESHTRDFRFNGLSRTKREARLEGKF